MYLSLMYVCKFHAAFAISQLCAGTPVLLLHGPALACTLFIASTHDPLAAHQHIWGYTV